MFEVLIFWFFLNYSNELDEEMTKTKLVDLNEIYNFVIEVFFIWNHLRSQIRLKFLYFEIYFLNYSNKLRWRHDQNQTCKSRCGIQLCSWRLLHFKSFMDPKLYLIFSYFEIQNFRIVWTNLDGVNKTKLVYIDEI